MTVRSPAVAGTFYPAQPDALRRVVNAAVVASGVDQVAACVGSFAPVLPPINDVMKNTYKAATGVPRVPSLSAEERERAKVTISILSHLRPLRFGNEAELLAGLRPEVDGLAIRDGERRSLFLPKVWESYPQPQEFLARLKRKAGLPAEPLSSGAAAVRFTTETFTG